MVLSIHHLRYRALREHLKALRRSAGLTQTQLAIELQDEQSYISKIERGERYVDVLFYVDWCCACGVPPNEAIKTILDSVQGSRKIKKANASKKSDNAPNFL